MARKTNAQSKFVYRHNNGKYLEMCYIGDGEVELRLVSDVTSNCILENDNWPLEEIIEAGSGEAQIEGSEFIEINKEDFQKQNVEIRII